MLLKSVCVSCTPINVHCFTHAGREKEERGEIQKHRGERGKRK